MKYALLIYLDDRIYETMPPDEMEACLAEHGQLQSEAVAKGQLGAAVRLAPASTAVRVVTEGAGQTITDGPFPETKEHLVGLYLLDTATLEEAMAYAARIPVDPRGTVEIRPVAWDLAPG